MPKRAIFIQRSILWNNNEQTNKIISEMKIYELLTNNLVITFIHKSQLEKKKNEKKSNYLTKNRS